MASASVWRIVEYKGIPKSTRCARADPVSVRLGEAEASTAWVALETAVDDIVDAPVSAGVGDFEVSLASIRSSGGVGDDEVLDRCEQEFGESICEFTYHTARVGGRDSIHHSAPDVKILASTAIGIGSASIAQFSTCLNVIPIEEREAHVLLRSSLT
jgi:hypothetical protein